MNASLTIVGSGIKFLSHLTTETKAHIEQADVLLYLVNEPAMEFWLQKANPCSESLFDIYRAYEFREDSYSAITKYILKILRTNKHVCVVFYGHPTVFTKPGLDAVIQARGEGYLATILPGISAEDCMFADLLIDPGSCGCQSFETSDLLIYQRKIDPSSHLVLWQISIIGALNHPKIHDNASGIRLLLNYLEKDYSLDHEAILYVAAQYPTMVPIINKITLKELEHTQIERLSTLYVPPAVTLQPQLKALRALGINS